MNKKNKITFIVNHAAYLVSHRLDLVERIIDKGWRCQILIGQPGSKLMEEQAKTILKKKNIDFIVNSYDASGLGVMNLIGLFQVIFHLFRFRPDMVHLISPKAILIGGIASRILRVKLMIIAITGVGFIFLSKKNIKKKIIKYIYFKVLNFIFKKKNKRIIFQNNSDMLEFKRNFFLKDKDLFLIEGSGVKINNSNVLVKNKKSNNIILPSRLLIEKGVLEYINAARVLKKEFPNWNFLIAGAADYDNPSSLSYNLIKYYQKEGIINWSGYVSDMDKMYENSSIVCLPSYREGFPKCLIEAANFGIPTVTTDVPGCRDAIIPNKTGLLVEPKNYLSLANGLKKLIKDEKLRKSFGENGYFLAKEKFDINHVIVKTLKLYNS